jgi:lysophospholipase L1-like esterase
MDMTKTNDPYGLGPGETEALLAAAPWRRLVVMGDSIAAGLGDPVAGYLDASWADRLAAGLPAGDGNRTGNGIGPAYLNLGTIGARAAEVRDAQLGPALAFGPDLAVVTAGANDALRRSFAPAAVEAELERIVGALTQAGALVVTFSCFDLGRTSLPPEDRRAGLSDRLRTHGALTEAVARRHGGVHVPFLGHPALGDDLFSADRLHLNRRGHAIVAAEIVRALARHLQPSALAVMAAT